MLRLTILLKDPKNYVNLPIDSSLKRAFVNLSYKFLAWYFSVSYFSFNMIFLKFFRLSEISSICWIFSNS